MSCLLSAARLVIDAGHGAHDSGAHAGGVREKDLVLVYADALATELRGRGHIVGPARGDDTFVGLSERAAIANEFGAAAFVSVHANASDNPRAHGAWVIHHHSSEPGEALARKIAGRWAAAVHPDRSGWTGGRGLAVLRETHMPAVLIELGFLTNPAERALLAELGTSRHATRAIADGIEDWLRRKP